MYLPYQSFAKLQRNLACVKILGVFLENTNLTSRRNRIVGASEVLSCAEIFQCKASICFDTLFLSVQYFYFEEKMEVRKGMVHLNKWPLLERRKPFTSSCKGLRGLFYHCTAISAGVNHFWPCKHFWILQINIPFVKTQWMSEMMFG